MNSKFISIIIPSYNYQNFIANTIESVINQTYDNWELIIVDDGSTDDSLAIIEKYRNNSKIKIFQHENGVNKGLKDTILLGLEKSKGDYIAFLESDDWWEKNYLEKKAEILDKNENIKFIFNNVELCSEKKNITWYETYLKSQKKILKKEKMPCNLEKYFIKHNFIPTFSCVLVEKKLLESCDFNPTADPTLDFWLFKQLASKTKFYYVPNKLTNWRLHDDSYINSIFIAKGEFEGFIEETEKYSSYSKKNIKKISLFKKFKQKFNSKISNSLNIISKKRYNILKNKYDKLYKDKQLILDYLYKKNENLYSEEYVEKSDREFTREHIDPKIIAFYLPQFHTIPENDEWWGKGFTEWTNVTTGQPQFVGHYQPKLPDELGFYDLANEDVFLKQIDLAKKYGIYGFCFHYYWFSGGKRLLEKPIFNFLKNKSLDLPFMLCWANEPWSRRWDGSEDDILMSQEFNEEDILKFIQGIMPFFKDKRYIKINNSPILIVYRPPLIKKELMLKTIELWREEVKNHGFDDLYLMHTRTGRFEDTSSEWGFNASLEFPPNDVIHSFRKNLKFINPNFKGEVFDLPKTIIKTKNMNKDSLAYKTVLPSWDNTARKKNESHIFSESSPLFYKKWLFNSMKKTEEIHPNNKMIFVNAWNEWAEGAYLEPDKKYGFAYLEATLDALIENRTKSEMYDLEK